MSPRQTSDSKFKFPLLTYCKQKLLYYLNSCKKKKKNCELFILFILLSVDVFFMKTYRYSIYTIILYNW